MEAELEKYKQNIHAIADDTLLQLYKLYVDIGYPNNNITQELDVFYAETKEFFLSKLVCLLHTYMGVVLCCFYLFSGCGCIAVA